MSEFYQETLLRTIVVLTASAGAAAQPVSYSREVAPILAMNCHLCHGANPQSVAGGLSTRSAVDLLKGGNRGQAIVPGDLSASALYQYISGARGEEHRMPLGGKPLAAGEIDAICRWIAQGAHAGADDSPKYRLTISKVKVERTRPVRITARVAVRSYIELELTDARGRILYADGGALREDRGVAAIGAPGEPVVWNLRRAPDWPATVQVHLNVMYPAAEPVDAVLTAGPRTAVYRAR